MTTPRAGILIGALAVARIPLDKWVRFVAPLLAMIIIGGMTLLTVGLYRILDYDMIY